MAIEELLEQLEEATSTLEEIQKGIEDMAGDNARIQNHLEEINEKLESEDVDITE